MRELTINKHGTREKRGKSKCNFYYIEKLRKNKKELNVYHTIAAREGTEAGNYYNQTFLELV